MSDDLRILHVASAVAEGSPVNWEEAEQQAPDEGHRSIVRALRLLSDIRDVARNPSSKSTDDDIPVSEPAPTVWGHLRIIDRLGYGAFGTVFRAWDSTLEREVALKLLPEVVDSHDIEASRAIKEARRLARVRHPNVVTIHGAECHDGRFGLWMELIGGSTLQDLQLAQGTMSAREAASVGMDICHALAAVHRARLLHGDIKATNVMREDGGRVVLMDFGAGRQIPREGEQAQGLAGTPLYLAPELFAGRPASVASDIYSLGVLLYHLVSGRYPVVGNDRTEIAAAHTRRQRLSLRDARPDLQPAFVGVIDRALEPNPKERFTTAGEFGAALADVVGARFRRDEPRTTWKVAAAVAGGVALLVGAVQVGRFFSGQPLESTARPVTAIDSRSSPLSAGPLASAEYEISAAFYAMRAGQPVRLVEGSRVSPGDQIFLSVDASQPVFVYVVNHDEVGKSYLLFPLPGIEPANPVQSGRATRLPGTSNAEEHYWEVTSRGGREHFFVYVAPDRLTAFEELLAALPRAEIGRPVESVPLTAAAEEKLRGVGGLATASRPSTDSAFAIAELKVLPGQSELARGVWARRIAFENPLR